MTYPFFNLSSSNVMFNFQSCNCLYDSARCTFNLVQSFGRVFFTS